MVAKKERLLVQRKGASPPSVEDYELVRGMRALELGAYVRAFKSEHLCMTALCVYMVFEYVRPQELIPALDVLPWSSIALLTSLATLFSDRRPAVGGEPTTVLFWMFFGWLAISSLVSGRAYFAWLQIETLLTWVFLYICITTIVTNERRLLLLAFVYVLVNLKMAQSGGLTWAQRGFSFAGYGLVGSPGWFRNSGEYAIQMVMFCAFVAPLWLGTRSTATRFRSYLLLAIAGLAGMAVMGASSRGAQLAFGAMCAWTFVNTGGIAKIGARGSIGLLLAISIAYLLVPEEQLARFEGMGTDETSLNRLAYWDAGLQVISDHPIFGIGFNAWLPYITLRWPEGLGPGGLHEVIHSIWLQAATETGVPGLLLLVLLLISAFRCNADTRRRLGPQQRHLFYLAHGLDAGLVGYLIAGSFVTVLFYPYLWVQLSFTVGLNRLARLEGVTLDSKSGGRPSVRARRGSASHQTASPPRL